MRTRWFQWCLVAIAALWLALSAAPVLAQSTGGSFGGGSFSGGGGSYGGGGGFGGGSSSFGGGSYSGGGYSSGGGGGGTVGFVFTIIFIAIWLAIQYSKYKKVDLSSHGAQGWNQVDISAIRLGIDWRARRELQGHLEQLAKSGQTATKSGLASLLRETILGLRRAELAWLYSNVANYHPMSPAMAEGIFRQIGVDARSKFRHELVRNADGSTSAAEAPAMRAHPNEGEGVVVVTLIVAARREILDVYEHQNADSLKRLLDDMAGVANPHSLVALEVIWSPAAEDDRMSTAELEQHYPDLKKIDERSIAGRVFCSYCQGPFAMELLKCPHCGAPAPGADAARA